MNRHFNTKKTVFEDPSWAPLFCLALAIVILALGALMIYNYWTTYVGFALLGLGTALAIILTALVQMYQLAYPAAAASGKLNDIPFMIFGLGVFWIGMLVADAATGWAFLRMLSTKPGATTVIQVIVVLIFLLAEWIFWPLLKAFVHFWGMIEWDNLFGDKPAPAHGQPAREPAHEPAHAAAAKLKAFTQNFQGQENPGKVFVLGMGWITSADAKGYEVIRGNPRFAAQSAFHPVGEDKGNTHPTTF